MDPDATNGAIVDDGMDGGGTYDVAGDHVYWQTGTFNTTTTVTDLQSEEHNHGYGNGCKHLV